MPHFKKRADRWTFASWKAEVAGSMQIEATHLGSMLSIFATNKPERRKRMQGVRSAWASLGQFWTSGAPEKYKRLVFMSQVLGTAVSGLAAFAIEP
eukprot:7892707-Heterocapsa_arctica.AAC.1